MYCFEIKDTGIGMDSAFLENLGAISAGNLMGGIITADIYDEDMQKVLSSGMNAHLAKLIQQERLFHVQRNFYIQSISR